MSRSKLLLYVCAIVTLVVAGDKVSKVDHYWGPVAYALIAGAFIAAQRLARHFI
jgi:hypothetical protein